MILAVSLSKQEVCTSSEFLRKLSVLFDTQCTENKESIFVGDFNNYFDVASDPVTKQTQSLLSDSGLSQYEHSPTQEKCHTLNILIAPFTNCLIHSVVALDKLISDHKLILCELNINKQQAKKKTVTLRHFKAINIPSFKFDLKKSTETFMNKNVSVDTCNFDSICKNVLGSHAPMKS